MANSTGAPLSARQEGPRFCGSSQIAEKGMKLIIWNKNDPGEIRRAMDLGVMSIISDYLERALEV